jgi:hypothetical protein
LSGLANDFLDAIEKRHPRLSASRTLLIALAAVAIGGFGFAKLLDSAQIAGLERDRDAFKSLATLYEAKLKVGSPDEALKKLENLQATVEQLRPKADRRLSDDEMRDLEIALAPLASSLKPSLILVFEPTGEGTRYAFQFKSVFDKLKVPTIGINGFGLTNDDHGVLVGLKDPKQPSDLALKFIDALRRGGIDVKTTVWKSDAYAEQFPLDFDLFIAPP